MLPSYEKQLEYAAYACLSSELWTKLTMTGYTRFPQAILMSIIDKSTALARDHYDCVIPGEPDDIAKVIDKFVLLSSLDSYKTYVYKVANAYRDAFAKLEGPTRSELKDVMSGIMESVIKDLLAV